MTSLQSFGQLCVPSMCYNTALCWNKAASKNRCYKNRKFAKFWPAFCTLYVVVKQFFTCFVGRAKPSQSMYTCLKAVPTTYSAQTKNRKQVIEQDLIFAFHFFFQRGIVYQVGKSCFFKMIIYIKVVHCKYLLFFSVFLKHELIFGTKFHCSRLRIFVVMKKMDSTIGQSNFCSENHHQIALG